MRLKLNREANEWEVLTEDMPNYEDYDIIIDEYLLIKAQNIEKLQKRNWDTVFMIVGGEGSGKSTLGFIFGQYFTKMGLTLDNICNGTDEAMEKLKRLPDGSVLIVDEAELLFSSRDTMTREQKQLIKIMQIIRQKRMILILITPSFFDMSKYIAVDRSRFLIRVFADRHFNRGNWAYWGTQKKLKLYYEGKKNYGSYRKPKPQMFGYFRDYKLPFDEEYQKVKYETLMKAFEKKESYKKTKVKKDNDDVESVDNVHAE